MPLKLNTLLAQEGLAPADVRLLRHQDARAARDRSPYALWRDDRPAFERYQSAQNFANRSKLRAPHWAAFVVAATGETLFAGLYASAYRGVNETQLPWPHADGFDPPGSCDLYDLVRDQRFVEFEGRLVIDWGAAERTWIQRADRQDKPIVELREAFREPAFPGFTAFMAHLSDIPKLPRSWVNTLSSSGGVYLLSCPRTHEWYVGSATGAEGFYARWMSYALTGHGGNVALKSRDPSDYRISILEVAGSSDTADQVRGLESLWKQKLGSREMGLNRN